jgi:uncharacterized repeat protein (TIGR01451 family)
MKKISLLLAIYLVLFGLRVTVNAADIIPANLIVIKHVINDNGGVKVASDFSLSLNHGAFITATTTAPLTLFSTFSGQESPGTSVSLDPGEFSVVEIPNAGYQVSYSADCSGIITAGQTKTCVVTNNDIAPKLTVIKNVVGGIRTPADFTIHVFNIDSLLSPFAVANFPGASGAGTMVDISAGDYFVNEDPYFETSTTTPGYYNPTYSAGCTDIAQLGQNITCTITNIFVPGPGAPVPTPTPTVVTTPVVTPTPIVGCLLVSGTQTQSAGYATTSPVADPLNPSLYSGAGIWSPAAIANTVIPPWIDPATHPAFSGSGAQWVSNIAQHPGFPGGQGLPTDDQWRLFQMQFVASSTNPVTLTYTADNAASIYLNGSLIDSTVALDTYAPTPGVVPIVYTNTYSVTFSPQIGVNSIKFVVRNSSEIIPNNPTALLYKLHFPNLSDCPVITPTPTPSGSGGGGGGGSSGGADLSLIKTVNPVSVSQASTVVFTLIIGNAGPDTATGVTLQENFPGVLSFVSASSTQGNYNSSSGIWTVGTLASGASATLEITAVVNADPGILVNSAIVTGTLTDPNISNNSASVNLDVTSSGGSSSKVVGGGGGGGGGSGSGGPFTLTSPIITPTPVVAGAFTGTPSGLPAPTGDGLTDGEILGATTSLPRTGMPATWGLTIVVLALIAAGLVRPKKKFIV